MGEIDWDLITVQKKTYQAIELALTFHHFPGLDL